MKLPKLTPPELGQIKNFVFPGYWNGDDKDVMRPALAVASNNLVAPGIHYADNFFTWGRNNSMLDDLEFVRAWESNVNNDPNNIAILWRRYILATLAYHCVQLDGDFVECGCYTADGVKLVVDYLGGTEFPRTFWAYDLFEHATDEEHPAMPQHGAGLFETVKQKFASYPQVKIVRGRIPGVFAASAPERISYLHIDLNQAPAELAALDALFERVVPGGVVILDDYEWALSYRGQKLAEDPWFDARDYHVVPLPTGQGLVIKR